MGVAFYKGADCCVLVYDITNTKSYENLSAWKEDFLLQVQVKDPSKFPFILVGNKLDMETERKISSSRATGWCQENGAIPFFEVSAMSGANIDSAFDAVAVEALRCQERMACDVLKQSVRIGSGGVKKSGCC